MYTLKLRGCRIQKGVSVTFFSCCFRCRKPARQFFWHLPCTLNIARTGCRGAVRTTTSKFGGFSYFCIAKLWLCQAAEHVFLQLQDFNGQFPKCACPSLFFTCFEGVQ